MIADKMVGRDLKVDRGRNALVNPTRKIKLGSVTGAEEPPLPVGSEIRWREFRPKNRGTTQMGADSHGHKDFRTY
jgi:hypothetical protein